MSNKGVCYVHEDCATCAWADLDDAVGAVEYVHRLLSIGL